MTTRRGVRRPPFWRDVRVLRVAYQLVVLLAVFLALQWLFGNLMAGLRRIGLGFNFDFLGARAGFAIQEGIAYSPGDSYGRAYVVGLVNTLRVVVVGLLLTSFLGLFAGIARLSTNWLVRRLAAAYVETFRNTPLLVQLVFWYTAVLLKLPLFDQAVRLLDLAFFSVRGTAVPWLAREQPGFRLWLLVLAGGIMLAWWVRRTLVRRSEATGEPIHVFLWAVLAFLVTGGVGYLATGSPAAVTLPAVEGRIVVGGAVLTPEFTALLVALVIYTAAFIAEIVRGAILAVPRGQTEAALALGLTNAQRLRLVVIPQAMRIIVPPLANQYLNLTKNSSLAFAVAFPDLFQVSKVMINQSGQAVPIITMVMLTYLAMSLTISALSNLANQALAYPTR